MLTPEAIKELRVDQATAASRESIEKALTGSGAAALHQDFKLCDLESYMSNRRRLRGTMTTSCVEDFIAYSVKNKEPGASIFIDADSMSASAVLNIGTTDKPGHADNVAKLTAYTTAAYAALTEINGMQRTQRDIAEFIEDWAANISCMHNGEDLPTPKAASAVRNITIDMARKIESEERSLSASKSTMDSVTASSKDTLPTEIRFKCVPFKDMTERTFALRLSVITSRELPALCLRIIKLEEHKEQMAYEMADKIKQSLEGKDEEIGVLLGKYSTK